MSKKSKKGAAAGPFVMHTREMFISAAWRVLSLSARRLLDRIEIEMMSHGGPRSNGRFQVTYGDFTKYGVRRNSIASTLREAVALGFVEITQQGRAGNAAYRKANQFRLTYHKFRENPDGEFLYEPTNECRRFPLEGDLRPRAFVPRSGQDEYCATNRLHDVSTAPTFDCKALRDQHKDRAAFPPTYARTASRSAPPCSTNRQVKTTVASNVLGSAGL